MTLHRFPGMVGRYFRAAFAALTAAALFIGLGFAAEPIVEAPNAHPVELLPTDSRRWSQSESAVILSDLSKAEPAAALTKGRREKGRWKVLPYATADSQGWALSTYSLTEAPVVRLPLEQRGWYAIYVGVATMSTGYDEMKNGLQAKLSDEPVFKRMANNVVRQSNRVDVVQEGFLTVSKLHGQSLEIASLPNLPAIVCYVKLVPLTEAEASAWSSQRGKSDPATRTAIATFDGHSWIWPYNPQTADDLRATFRGFESSDIGKWWFQVLGADLVCYPSQVGSIPGEETADFNTRAHGDYVRSLKHLIEQGVHPLQVAREEAAAQGAEFHVMLRPAGWQGAIPFEETFDSDFFEKHPEWRCVDRDGTPTLYMSYAVAEVRRHLLEVLREALAVQPDGVGLLFNRGMPMILWEEAFCERFRQEHDEDPRQLAENDPRILATRAAIMTDFLREIRGLLDEVAREQGRTQRYKISLGAFGTEADNQKFGIDLPRWVQAGLVDDLGVAWFAYHTSFSEPDMAYYNRITAGTNVGVYPFLVAWKSGMPKALCEKVTKFYDQGADGIAIWDPSVEAGWTGSRHGNLFDTLSRLGHREVIARWAKEGVPLPNVVPLTRLDENYYSRWFPNTGF
jgi:hypothetical protein